MKTTKFMFALASVIILNQSCDKDNEELTFTNSYLPLEVGNYWYFDNSDKIEIAGTATINEKTFYILKSNNDTNYYRIENDKVYVKEYNNEVSVKFILSADVDDTWKFNSYTVKLISKTDTVLINDKKITNCYHFFFSIPHTEDSEFSIWLAPEIGFIQKFCGNCYHGMKKLEKAKIDEKETQF